MDVPGGGATVFLIVVLVVGSFTAGFFFSGSLSRRWRSRKSRPPTAEAWSTRVPDPPPPAGGPPWSTESTDDRRD